MYKKIIIFGNSASGKSTYAKKIAGNLDSIHFDLDTIAWQIESQDGPKRLPLDESYRLIQEFIGNRKSWVIEGCYSDLLTMIMPQATEIIFLNPGIDRCIENAKYRPWEAHKYDSPELQNANLTMLIEWIKQYEVRDDEFSLRAHQKLFDDFPGIKHEFNSNIEDL